MIYVAYGSMFGVLLFILAKACLRSLHGVVTHVVTSEGVTHAAHTEQDTLRAVVLCDSVVSDSYDEPPTYNVVKQ